MDNNKKLKLLGAGVALVGFVVSMLGDSIKDKQHSEDLKNEVAKQVSEKLAEIRK